MRCTRLDSRGQFSVSPQAISYYEAALKGEGGAASSHRLRLDLAELHLRLRHFERAEKTLSSALKSEDGEP